MQTASYHEQKNHKYRSLVVLPSLSQVRVSEAERGEIEESKRILSRRWTGLSPVTMTIKKRKTAEYKNTLREILVAAHVGSNKLNKLMELCG